MLQTEQDEKSLLVCREDVEPHIAHLVIDRPEVRNAINSQVSVELREQIELCEQDPQIRVIVISGRSLPDGKGIFSAGLDLGAFAERGDVGDEDIRGFGGITRQSPNKPIIAAVEGFALAGGFEIALACDMIVASTDAEFGLPEVTRGLVADGGALLRLPHRIPLALAMEFALTGARIQAKRLLSLGIVNRIVGSGDAVDEAHKLGRLVALNPPEAVQATKEILLFSDRAAAEQGTQAPLWEEQAAVADRIWNSQEAVEGATAFKEKRPSFEGS